jgi:hypothetical protein
MQRAIQERGGGVAGGLRLRALRRGSPTEDIVSAYGTARCKSSRPKLPPELPPGGLVHAAADTPASRGRPLRRRVPGGHTTMGLPITASTATAKARDPLFAR